MKKIVLVDYTKCTGCRLCETVCSLSNEGEINPQLARIKMIRWEWEGLQIPTICQQCDDAACMAVCPVKAISKDKELGHAKINYELCIGCKLCLMVCPFGAVSYDFVHNRVIKCELCDGDPVCVKFCETKALQYVDMSMAAVPKKRDLAEKILTEVSKSEAP